MTLTARGVLAAPGSVPLLSDHAQPYKYPRPHDFSEPDWRRLPGYREVTEAEWESARWQRQHSVKNLDELEKVYQHLLPSDLL